MNNLNIHTKVESEMIKAPTMKDVARVANVSQATVSYVINNSAPVSEAVKQRVFDAINTVGYIANANAKSLKTQRTNTVGILIPDIDSGYYSEMIKETEHFLRKNGFVMFLCNTSYDPLLERRYIATLIEQNVLGIIIGYGLVDSSIYNDLQNHSKNVVVLDDRVCTKDIEIPSIEIDNIKAGQIAVSHLLSTGSKKICFASEPLFNRSLQNRYKGFRLGIEKYQLEDKNWCEIIEQRQYQKVEMGYNIGAKILLDGEIDAVFATSDNLAYGIVQQLLEYGKQIPNDLVIMGFDDIPLAKYMTPKLTTISQPIREVAGLAVKSLIRIIEGIRVQDNENPLEPLLIIRESTLRVVNPPSQNTG